MAEKNTEREGVGMCMHESRLHYGYDIDGVLMPSGPQKISLAAG